MAKSADAFRTISEVADWLGTPAHVLRFWESKFTQVKPVKRAGGRRYYRPADMELLGGIKQLLHEEGMTIKGVQKLLRERGVDHVAALSPRSVVVAEPEPTEEEAPAPAPDEAPMTLAAEPEETQPQVVPFRVGTEPEPEPEAPLTEAPAPPEPAQGDLTADAAGFDPAGTPAEQAGEASEEEPAPDPEPETFAHADADAPESPLPSFLRPPKDEAPARPSLHVDVPDDPADDDISAPHGPLALVAARRAPITGPGRGEVAALLDRLSSLAGRGAPD